jgi:hypothetical protein
VRDVSAVPPYSKHVGVTYRLKCPAELLDDSLLFPPCYSVVVRRVPGGSDNLVVAKVPPGYPVKVEEIRQEDRWMLIGGFCATETSAVVSLNHPNYPWLRIRAEVPYPELEQDMEVAGSSK